MEKYYLAAKVL